ncbi:hypothetical protein GCM10023196_060860 [Actinoallomurus vinaceus]|uniref:Uncharacterized protein n=1 Tax=Actinoallomurus vinaceus TaxID=1080074 RepID=A0ABP8UJJ9_9ACTN
MPTAAIVFTINGTPIRGTPYGPAAGAGGTSRLPDCGLRTEHFDDSGTRRRRRTSRPRPGNDR